VDLIVADTTVAVRAAMQATSTIPIVIAASADAVEGGLVSNLRRPGGNVTGNSLMLAETGVKRCNSSRRPRREFARGRAVDPAAPFSQAMLKEIDAAAPSLRLQALAIAVKSRDDLGDVLSEITRARADGCS